MLEFYEFNSLNICIVLIATFITYYLLNKFFGNDKNNHKNKDEFSLEFLLVSVLIAVTLSLIIAYVLTSKDESILTDNFWDPIEIQTDEL